MRTARSSSRHGGSPQPPGSKPPWAGTPPPQSGPGAPPLARFLSTSPLVVGLETPRPDTPQFPPGCGPGNLQGMLGYHPPPRDPLEGMLGYNPPPPRPAARHAGIPPARHAGIPPPLNRITKSCKNITFPQLRMRAVTKDFNCVLFNNTSLELFCNVYRYCEVWEIDDYGSRSSFVTIDVHPPSPKPASMLAAVMC